MAKWQFNRTIPVDYPTLGFIAEPGDILSDTNAPDGWWSSVTDTGQPETVARYTGSSQAGSYVEPPDGYLLTWSDAQNQYVGKGPVDALPQFSPNGRLSGWPMYAYGNSYGVVGAGWHSTGKHYLTQANTALEGGSLTSYAVGGKRILDVLSAVVNESALTGLVTAPVAGAKWPGTSSRQGLVVLESSFNDIGHYATMVGTALPVALPSGNTRYKDSLRRQYTAALAVLSSESRIENGSFTTSGTWSRGAAAGYASGSTVDFSTSVGAYSEVSVTPPQFGPLAGKVFLLTYTVDPALGTPAAVNVTVDGGAVTPFTPTPWEQYAGPGGANVQLSWDVIPVTVPVDGAAHTVRFTHNGSAGHLLYIDCLLIPSTDPNPIAVMGSEHGPKVALWNSTQVATFKANQSALTPQIKAAVGDFPNAVYVPSTMTPNGLYSGDGIHPNDRGMTQRFWDLITAVQSAFRARFLNRAISAKPDSDYTII